jgi:hypothetical protein
MARWPRITTHTRRSAPCVHGHRPPHVHCRGGLCDRRTNDRRARGGGPLTAAAQAPGETLRYIFRRSWSACANGRSIGRELNDAEKIPEGFLSTPTLKARCVSRGGAVLAFATRCPAVVLRSRFLWDSVRQYPLPG